VVEISPERVTGPEQGKSNGRVATFSLWTGLTTIEPINQTLEKKVEKIKNMGKICTQFHKSRQFICSLIQGLRLIEFC
jgi:hypothetical protein